MSEEATVATETPAATAVEELGGGVAAPEAVSIEPSETWTTGMEEGTRTYVESKGWKGAGDLAESYRSFEKFHGVPQENLLKLPSEDAEPDAWGDVFNRLGRPEKAEGYELKDLDEGSDLQLMPAFKSKAHELGISQKQAEGLVGWFEALSGEMAESTQATQTRDSEVSEQAALVALRQKWGTGYEQGIRDAQSAIAMFGFQDKVEPLIQALGVEDSFTFFRGLYDRVGEHKPAAGSQALGPFSGTPESAKTEITRLKADPEFVKKALVSGSAEQAKLWSLNQMAHPEG